MKRNHPTPNSNDEQKTASVPIELILDLANRKPSHDPEKHLYRLRHYVNDQISCDSDGTLDPYPKYHITEYACKLYKTRDDAEHYIRDIIANEGKREEVHHFTIEQLSFGKSDVDAEATWLYDHNGDLVDWAMDGRYYGRSPERIRFRRGDIVEVITCNKKETTISLAIVVNTPPSIQECYERYNVCLLQDEGYEMSVYADDCYMVADAKNSNTVSIAPTLLLKPRYEITDELREYFNDCLRTYDLNKPGAPRRLPPYNVFNQMSVVIGQNGEQEKPCVEIWSDRDELITRLCVDRQAYCDNPENCRRLTAYEKKALMQMLTTVDCGRTLWWYLIRHFLEWNNDYDEQLLCSMPLPNYRLLPEQ